MSDHKLDPEIFVNSNAPTRICDNGGWTDTWFAKYGNVCNIAIGPCVQVQVAASLCGPAPGRITIRAENYGVRYVYGQDSDIPDGLSIIDGVLRYMPLSPRWTVEISVFSRMPPGSSTGSSASLAVALIGALDRLARLMTGDASVMPPSKVAAAAHHVETQVLERESGIQDQIAAAYGGINLITMHDYPKAEVISAAIDDQILWELDRRLMLIYVGNAHCSSTVHDMVIRELSADSNGRKLDPLRAAAKRAFETLCSGDLRAFGEALVQNNEAQSNLHPELVGEFHQEIVEIARSCGAWGWKVNGAGGTGGSVSVLHGVSMATQAEFCRKIAASGRPYKVIPIAIHGSGLQVWTSMQPAGTHGGQRGVDALRAQRPTIDVGPSVSCDPALEEADVPSLP